MLCLRKIPAAKNFMDKKGVSRFSVERFLSNSAEKIVGEPFIVSPIRVSKKIMFRRVMSQLFVENFCLAVPKNFAGEPFCAVFPKDSGSD